MQSQLEAVSAAPQPRVTRARAAVADPQTASSSEVYRSIKAQQAARRDELLQEMHRNMCALKGPTRAPLWPDGVPTERIKGAPYSTASTSFDPYALEGQRTIRDAEREQRVSLQYMTLQHDINSQMRTILIDWIVEVAQEYRLSDETLHLAVNYIDRFLSLVPVRRSKLQLVGITCAFLASKFEETSPAQVSEFVQITDDTYSRAEILRMEGLILSTLSFNLSATTSVSFLRRFHALTPDPDWQEEQTSRYLLELALQDYECLKYLPSMLAASAMCLSKIITAHHSRIDLFSDEEEGRKEIDCSELKWMEGLARNAVVAIRLSKYEPADLWPCVLQLHQLMRRAPDEQFSASYTKYSATVGEIGLEPPPTLPSLERIGSH